MSEPVNGRPQASTNPTFAGGEAEPTGRYLVVLADDVMNDERAMTATLQSVSGVSTVASASDFSNGALDIAQADQADAQLFPALGVAVVSAGADGASLSATADENPRITAIEPEQMLFALTTPGPAVPLEYLHGYRDAAAELYEHVSNGVNGARPGPGGVGLAPAAQFVDTAAFTWGLQATGVATSRATGQGIRVAMLDTGFDLQHADFAGRNVVSSSFVPGQAVQDGHGHGTHVTGTSSGPARPPGGSRRYGCASSDSIFIGKVLSDQGSGTDGQILAGIQWAITNRCKVVSMSLGAQVATSSPAYDTVGRRALAAGCLLVAAAGNSRQGTVRTVNRPANSPFIMAVGAVDADLQIAPFSSFSAPAPGAGVDIVGPGVAVYSSWPMQVPPRRYHTISGTSMATPHVAGIAAMWSQVTGATGMALWGELARNAKRLPLSSVDAGCGLVQAP